MDLNTVNDLYRNRKILVNLSIFIFYIVTAIFMSYFFTPEYVKTSLFYCFSILLAVFFAYCAEFTSNKIIFNILMFFSFAPLYFILGFREFSGIDDPTYINIFDNVSMMGWFEYFKSSTIEPGYLILNAIVAFFTDNYLYMQLITSFIPLCLFYYGFKKYRAIISLPTAVFLLCCMLFFQMLSVSLIRMFIAISIVFVALQYIPKFKPVKYTLLILLASTFHYSSFFMIILVYFAINKENLSKKVTKFYTIIFILSPIIFIGIGEYIVPLLGIRYQKYGDVGSINIGFTAFTTVPFIILFLLYYKKFKSKDQLFFKLNVFIYSLSIVISIFGSLVNLGRLIFYSYTAFILAAAMVKDLIRNSLSKFVFSYILILFGFLYLFYTQFLNESHAIYLYPYKNIFFYF